MVVYLVEQSNNDPKLIGYKVKLLLTSDKDCKNRFCVTMAIDTNSV